MNLKTASKTMITAETIFDTLYLCTVWVCAFLLLFLSAGTESLKHAAGWPALMLAAGDSCHLVPRIIAMHSKKTYDYSAALGNGKMIASVTMTLFYLELWHIGVKFYSFRNDFITAAVILTAAVRIMLCFFPQNRWADESADTKWALWRNIPFFILGAAVMVLFYAGSRNMPGEASLIWFSVMISFACYMPVVLFSKRNPKAGMFMILKSCAYVSIILMCFSLPDA